MADIGEVQVYVDSHHKQCVEALKRIALLADTGSDEHSTEFSEWYRNHVGVVPGWKLAERMREIANNAIGTTTVCESCGGCGQVQLTDEGGNRMWWACPACRG